MLNLAASIKDIQKEVFDIRKERKSEKGRDLVALLGEGSGLNTKARGSGPPDLSDSSESEDSKEENRRKRRQRRRRRRINIRESSEYSTPDDSFSEDEERHKASSKRGKSRERKEAEQSDVVVPASELTLRLNLNDSKRVAVRILLNWIAKSRSLTKHVAESALFEKSKNVRNRHEARAWARMGDVMINEMGWKKAIMLKFMEILTRRMWALRIACEQGNRWDLASTIEENKIDYDPAVTAQVGREMKQLKLRQSLKASGHRDKDGAGAN